MPDVVLAKRWNPIGSTAKVVSANEDESVNVAVGASPFVTPAALVRSTICPPPLASVIHRLPLLSTRALEGDMSGNVLRDSVAEGVAPLDSVVGFAKRWKVMSPV